MNIKSLLVAAGMSLVSLTPAFAAGRKTNTVQLLATDSSTLGLSQNGQKAVNTIGIQGTLTNSVAGIAQTGKGSKNVFQVTQDTINSSVNIFQNGKSAQATLATVNESGIQAVQTAKKNIFGITGDATSSTIVVGQQGKSANVSVSPNGNLNNVSLGVTQVAHSANTTVGEVYGSTISISQGSQRPAYVANQVAGYTGLTQ